MLNQGDDPTQGQAKNLQPCYTCNCLIHIGLTNWNKQKEKSNRWWTQG